MIHPPPDFSVNYERMITNPSRTVKGLSPEDLDNSLPPTRYRNMLYYAAKQSFRK